MASRSRHRLLPTCPAARAADGGESTDARRAANASSSASGLVEAHQGSSGCIKAHQGSSGLIRAHQGSSGSDLRASYRDEPDLLLLIV